MRKPGAFTLIELLVVVAIIALLISILLPSVENARRQGLSVNCGTHLNDIGKGIAIYSEQYNEWLPGSPVTSGRHLIEEFEDYEPEDVTIPGVATQAWDWAGPTAFYGMNMRGLPEHRAERMALLREGVFRCPSNNYVVAPYSDENTGEITEPIGPWPAQAEPHGPWPMMTMNSYYTFREMMYLGTNKDSDDVLLHPNRSWKLETPRGHAPKLTRTGRASEKILLAEGSRFWGETAFAPDFDIDYNARFGGAFSVTAPISKYSRSYVDHPDAPEEANEARLRHSFRHPVRGEFGQQSLFFDSHVEALSWTEFYTASDYWWPSGTKVHVTELKPKAHLRFLLSGRTLAPGAWYTIY